MILYNILCSYYKLFIIVKYLYFKSTVLYWVFYLNYFYLYKHKLVIYKEFIIIQNYTKYLILLKINVQQLIW